MPPLAMAMRPERATRPRPISQVGPTDPSENRNDTASSAQRMNNADAEADQAAADGVSTVLSQRAAAFRRNRIVFAMPCMPTRAGALGVVDRGSGSARALNSVQWPLGAAGGSRSERARGDQALANAAFACSNTSSNIAGVRRPVFVLRREQW